MNWERGRMGTRGEDRTYMYSVTTRIRYIQYPRTGLATAIIDEDHKKQQNFNSTTSPQPLYLSSPYCNTCTHSPASQHPCTTLPCTR